MTAAPAAIPPLARDAARDRMHAAYVAALLLAEAILLIVLVKLLTPFFLPDVAAVETLSVWAIGGALALGFAAARLLGSRELSNRQRIFWGLAITLIALQIIGRADLSESARIWDMSWLIDLGTPSSEVWRRAGALDELIAGLMLIPIWFRGVALGSDDLDERPFTRTVLFGFAVLILGFILADNAGVESIVQISAIVWALVCVVAVALKNSSKPMTTQQGGGIQTGLMLSATLITVTAGIAIALLLVVGIVAGVAGSGVVAPVLDALGFVLEYIVKGIAYLLYPIFWILREVLEAVRQEDVETIEILSEGVGLPPEDLDAPEAEPNPTPGIVLARVFGAIGALLLFLLLAWLFFRRFLRRRPQLEEERESVWSEADLIGDLFGGLRNLRGRFRRGAAAGRPDAPIAALYYEVLADADARGSPRPVSRTPLQFASVLERLYGSAAPADISNAFSLFRYAGREPDAETLRQLRQRWEQTQRPE